MDAFFASVEQRDDPSLRGKPVLVGGASRRGVVAAASYEARPFGVRSAMPMAEALRLCPHAVVVTPKRGRYEAASAMVFAIFRRYTPLVEGLSVDEAFLDVTGSEALFGDAESIAARIKADCRKEVELTASAGVAACKFVAKIASDLRKPDGLVVAPDDAADFLAPLPVERMWGIGPKSAPRLRDAGFHTLGDLARADEKRLERLMGSWGPEVRLLARGIDPRPVVPDGEAKTIGAEETFEVDLTSREEIEAHLLEQASRVAQRLIAENLSCGTVVVKLKYADFTVRSRRMKLPEPIADTVSMHEAARQLLPRFERGPVRLTGIAAADLQPGAPPPTLFPDATKQRREAVERLLADVSTRFDGGLTRAALAGRKE
jgi:DNA polymerase IV